MPKKPLSKSKLMLGMQCLKNFWLTLNKPELVPSVDAATQMQFDEGNEVGELARKHFGKGVLIDKEYWDFKGAHEATAKAIQDGAKLIFEASFLNDGLFSRADILKKTSSGWEMYEVKKSTSVKDYHFQDAAIQTHIMKSTGLKLKSVSITYINNECVYPNLKDLFTSQDITKDINTLLPYTKKRIEMIKTLVSKKAEPKIDIGPHCFDPFECPFKAHCWKHIPEKSVFDLPGLNAAKAWALMENGYIKISDLDPQEFKGNTKRAIEVTKKKKPFIDADGIKDELSSWQWPLYFFDFETIAPAIPRYKGTKPYAQVPFQFSCHVLHERPSSSKKSGLDNSKKGLGAKGSGLDKRREPKSALLKEHPLDISEKNLTHFEYLHTEASDPRPEIIKAMLKGLGTKGSIVSYNKAFEVGVIKKLAEFDKKNSKKLLALIDRFVDPLPIFKSHVYHPEFLGSFSIKNVAPALIGDRLSYDELEIGDGSSAQAHADMILRGLIKGKEKQDTITHLLTYCRQDTMAMVELVRWLMGSSQ